MKRQPGQVRDAIIRALSERVGAILSLREIAERMRSELGDVSPSSVRSYLQNNVGTKFTKVGRGIYRLHDNYHV